MMSRFPLRAMWIAGLVAPVCAALAATSTVTRGGDDVWISVAEGRLKTRVFTSADLSARPLLVLFLPGDLRNGDFQYDFAQAVAQGFASLTGMPSSRRAALGPDIPISNVVAVGVVRPGYEDQAGRRSDGLAGEGVGDNYTRDVSAAIATAIESLKRRYEARAVIVVGHSGGGTITANLIGDRPGLVDAALIVSCSCDVQKWRAKMQRERPVPIWRQPLPPSTLIPFDLVPRVSKATQVRLLVGDKDDVVEPDYSARYAAALRARGVDARFRLVPDAGHNMAMTRVVFEELATLAASY